MNIDLTSQEDQDDQEAEKGAPSPISVVSHSYPFKVGLGAPSRLLGSWFLVLGSWFLVLGSWFLVNIRYILWEENDLVQGGWMDGDGGLFFLCYQDDQDDQEAERVGADPYFG